ncbi:hypothetical protein D9757_010218 [Collybiopsis confluens]|uniref:Large ribosomal subunit protein uL15/eL18 domain-containing protein n=1 Tax=Collybiopsis confluens TaxID=2823264 RepID=A0A8H5GP81_9AGAR|nr:hypothetical protein D9757_014539 [Collybiopsis confluens]KAF5368656.1 hypothetical protein D9757_010218 [Collybiopsis confluens]
MKGKNGGWTYEDERLVRAKSQRKLWRVQQLPRCTATWFASRARIFCISDASIDNRKVRSFSSKLVSEMLLRGEWISMLLLIGTFAEKLAGKEMDASDWDWITLEQGFRILPSSNRLENADPFLKHPTNFDKYHPGYFGKVGMRHFHLTHNQYWRPIINVDKLWSLVPEEEKKGLKENSEVVPVIDTLRHGYAKILGNGQLPKLPFIVKARFVSEIAERKIKEAGGVVSLVA